MSSSFSRKEAIAAAKAFFENPEQYVVLDSETTGLRSDAEIIELGIKDLNGDLLYHGYFIPSSPIHSEVVAVHGLDLAVLSAKWATNWADAEPSILRILKGKTVLAYNSDFDARMLSQTMERYGSKLPIDHKCIMRMWQGFLGKSKPPKLQGDHTALGDCDAAIALLREMAAAETPESNASSQSIEESLRLYANLTRAIEALSQQRSSLEQQFQAHVETHGDVECYGVRARFKPGRKKTDHQAAAMEAGVADEIIQEFTTQAEPSTAWAKVTKQAGIDTKPYTVEGEPVFVVELDD